MAGLGTSELLIILAVVLLLFGSAKLPQLARSLGRSARILKTETHGLHDDDPAEPQTSIPPADAREQAARLREEAARLERQAGPQPPLPPARPRRASVQPTGRRDTDPARS
ncbi:twin-arginine translocase TatA/TatE family subunit [Actinomadura sp. NTSP31]|uniref:twin-arginine translocase TatA/TatE family subunit n=1 Tax=Actinomadura sp. NTSP31 TaxID=1735447 RepID=UPI0035BEF0FA